MANMIFFNHGRILLASLAIGMVLMIIAVLCIGVIMKSFPRRISVVSSSGLKDDPADPYGDNWPKFKYVDDTVMLPGGSEIMRGIDDNLAKHKLYNENVRKTAATTFGAPMIKSVIDRGSLFESEDDWGPEGAPSSVEPAPFTKEVTLFSF